MPSGMTDQDTSLTGSFRALLLFDIAEEIDLPLLRTVLGVGPTKREPAFRHPAPEYVRFERPPVVEYLGSCETDHGKKLQSRIRYFDYGLRVSSYKCRSTLLGTLWSDWPAVGSWRPN